VSYKYEIRIEKLEEPLPVSRELTKRVKESLGDVSRKVLSQMEREAVQCPVLGQRVPFLQCYVCENFVRRVKGVVHCRGNSLS